MAATKFRKGRFYISATLPHLKDVVREMEFSADHTLADLHNLILRAYHFDDDHKYSFFLDNIPFSENRYNDHRDKDFDEGPYSDEIMLGELSWNVGDSVLYVFNFVDEWLFNVKLLSIDEKASALMFPKVILSKGDAPPQYDNSDDAEEGNLFGFDDDDFDVDDETYFDDGE
ncbi:MAG: hypothetical protein KA010_02200 [Saprospiraceae bacterium]|nr:hypothetical protein [Saprospiraceae bacterium]